MPEPVLSSPEVREWISRNLPRDDFSGQRVLLIVPDATRTAPLPLPFDAVYQPLRSQVRQFDVLFALGTHPPMNERQMCRLLGIDEQERSKLFTAVGLFNHEWDVPERLLTLGKLTAAETAEISQGLLAEEVPVTINSRIADYDVLLV